MIMIVFDTRRIMYAIFLLMLGSMLVNRARFNK